MGGEPSKPTDAQHDTPVAAYKCDYFKGPRETMLNNLPKVLDISPAVVSGRIRRGTAEPVESILFDE